MLNRILALIIGVLIIGLITTIMILIPEINIIVFSAFLYVCIKSIKDVEFGDRFFIKRKGIKYCCIVLSIVIIVFLIVHLAIVDPSTLTYTLIVSFALFAVEIKQFIEFLGCKKNK